MADARFDLSATSDEFADYHLDEAEAAEWADELDRSGKAPHLFTPDPRFQPKPEERYGGYTAEQFEAMSAGPAARCRQSRRVRTCKEEALIKRCRSADNCARRDCGQG